MPLVIPPATNHTPAIALAAAKAASPSPLSPHYLIFFASIDENTGRSWCPDCRAVEGPLSAVPEGQSTLIFVGQRAEWKDPNNPFRLEFGLTGVPTILRVESADSLDHDTHSAARLVEDEILDEAKLKKFLA